MPLKADALKRMEAEVKNCTVDEGMLNTAYAWIRSQTRINWTEWYTFCKVFTTIRCKGVEQE